jgi:hypothetical protein
MSSRAVSLSGVGRVTGEGWCLFVRGAARAECITLPAGALGMSGEPFTDLNAGTIFAHPGAGDALRLFVGRLRARGLPGMVAVLSPVAAEAAPVAHDLGLTEGPPAPLMCVRAADAHRAEHDYAVWRVADQAGAEQAALVLAEAFQIEAASCRDTLGDAFTRLPGADIFAAGHHGEAAAVAGTARLGDIVGIYAVATRPAQRRSGAASAALTAAVDHHIARGAHLFCLQSAPDAEPLYRSLGFGVVDHPAMWHVGVD